VEGAPQGIAVSPDGTKVYVVNSNKYPYYKGTISVIDTATNNVTETINIGSCPQGIAVNPNGTRVYVAIDNPGVYSHTVNVDVTSHIGAVNVIDTATNEVIETVNVESTPKGIAVTPDGNKVYVVNYGSNTTSVINTATNKVDATVPVGEYPTAVGLSPATKPNYTQESNSTSLLNLINRTENQTNDTGAAANAETVSTQKIESSSNKASIPFISLIWVLVAVLGAVACIRKTK
jgi:YVTN family beta-propeller protein